MGELATDPVQPRQAHRRRHARHRRDGRAPRDRSSTTTSDRFEPPTEFVVPGQNRVGALLDVARTVARRAERDSLAAAVPDSAVVPYLNRLSDLLWTLARWQEGTSLPTRSVDPA